MNNLTPILSTARATYFEKFKLAWYFEKPYEKIILIVLSALGVLRIFQWFI